MESSGRAPPTQRLCCCGALSPRERPLTLPCPTAALLPALIPIGARPSSRSFSSPPLSRRRASLFLLIGGATASPSSPPRSSSRRGRLTRRWPHHGNGAAARGRRSSDHGPPGGAIGGARLPSGLAPSSICYLPSPRPRSIPPRAAARLAVHARPARGGALLPPRRPRASVERWGRRTASPMRPMPSLSPPCRRRHSSPRGPRGGGEEPARAPPVAAPPTSRAVCRPPRAVS